MPPHDCYASFMLRFQWMANDHHPTWVVSTQSTKTGELRWFPSLDALIQFLRNEFGSAEGLKDTDMKQCEGMETRENTHKKDSQVPGE